LRFARTRRDAEQPGCIGVGPLAEGNPSPRTESSMRVSEAMTRTVCMASPDQTLEEIARLMCDADIGCLPVRDNDRLVGMITDRDIAVRAVGSGMGPKTPVRDVMTSEVKYCFEDEDLDDVAQNMGEQQLRRLPVLDRQKRLVGVLALGDMALVDGNGSAGEALSQISRPGGDHSQSNESAIH
jgi:CBS domain-containing protein